jgi:hypothetical protein
MHLAVPSFRPTLFALVDTEEQFDWSLPIRARTRVQYGGNFANLIMTDATSVTPNDGVPGTDFQPCSAQQAASFVVPQPTGLITGAPVAGGLHVCATPAGR